MGSASKAHKTGLWRRRGESRESYCAVSCHTLVIVSLCVSALFVSHAPLSRAQNPDGNAASQKLVQERLSREIPNKYRGGEKVKNRDDVKLNMKNLFEKILIEGESDGKADEWYSPHLRDISGNQKNRDLESGVRGRTAPSSFIRHLCRNGNGMIEAACPEPSVLLGMGGRPGCRWHEDQIPTDGGKKSHRPWVSCDSRATTKYLALNQTSNFKMCCVREGEEEASSEYIAAMHPDGDGWAGLWEYYYPTLALGWENDRTTSMIVDKEKVRTCLQESDKIMEGAQQWVTGAINRNLQAVGGAPSGNIQQKVQDSIQGVRPKDQKLRFTDSLQSEGLTLRVNLAAMDPQQRQKTAQRFCMHPKQFDKLMNPDDDLLQLGGGEKLDSLDNIPVWSNYCPQGVELMTNPDNSNGLRNLDGTPTDLSVGMRAWQVDPMYCQKMNLTNVNMFITGLGRAALQSPGAFHSQQSVGYTCLDGGKLNGSMVPVELYRHAAVERRTAITDHALGFLIAGGVAPTMTRGNKSYYKRFEPQPYSKAMPYNLQTFIGTRFGGGGTNELGKPCPSVAGENYRFAGSKSDRLYISDVTNKAFDQEKVEAGDPKGGINRYREEWGKDQQSAAKIAARGLDEESQNYAAPFRIFATCPKGYKRWRPQPEDTHNQWLIQNVNMYCREENFGGRP